MADDHKTVGETLIGLLLAAVAMVLLVGTIYGIGWGLYLLWGDVICKSLIVCQ